MAEDVDAVVIGAGEAGAVVASLAVEAGKRVAMIYKSPYGSTCVNTGCVPSKFLIHRARIAHLARTAARFHVQTSEPRVDLGGIVDEKNEMIVHHREEALESARAAERLLLVEGDARFTSRQEVAAGGRTFRAEQVFIATGMRPAIPRIEGIDRVDAFTNETLMELKELPERLVVIGGGYIACELGQAFHRYGSRVTIIQSGERLCPHEEPDVSTLLERALRAEGVELVLGHRATRVEPDGGGVRVVAHSADGDEQVVEGTHVLVAAGRLPNTDALGLDAAGVETDRHGYVRVDEYLRTSVPGIWAVGDVNGQQPFTRVCQEEAKVAYANAFEGADIAMERLHLGHAVFTDPEIGSVGLTEREARERGYDVAAGLVTFDQVEKAEIIGETTGLIKYVAERRTHRLLGCHVIGPGGADLVYDAVVVMRHGGTLDELAKAVGIFPTVQEGMEGAARGLLRRMAPQETSGPLVVGPVHRPGLEAAEEPRAGTAFTCPACAADLEVRTELEARPTEPHPKPRAETLSCPACAADLEVRERLEEPEHAGEPA
jgi:mercury(II) reductase